MTSLTKKIEKYKKKWKKRRFEARRERDRKKIKNRDFTIISNNCWGGHAYRYFDRSYSSPTVGLFFPYAHYVKFVYNLRYYMSLDLTFIPWEESPHAETIRKSGKGNVPIGVLDDIHIIFLHYKSEEEAYEKWNRRRERMNFDNIIIKFSNLGPASEEVLKKFSELPFKNKFLIINRKKKDAKYPCEVEWRGYVGPNGDALDTEDFPGNLNLRRLLDLPPERYPEEGYPL